MQNILINMCEKFHYDRLRNDRALGNGKSDNNKNLKKMKKKKQKNKNNVCGHWGHVSGSKTADWNSSAAYSTDGFIMSHVTCGRTDCI